MAVATSPQRGDVYLVQLNPTRGSEIRKTRPYPFRIPSRFAGKDGHVGLDKVHVVDRERLTKRLGALTEPTLRKVLGVLQQMFAW